MIGLDIHNLAKELWPLNRSITGEGVRNTLQIINKHIPNLAIKSIPSGSTVFDWEVPKEWHVNEAYIICPNGDRICKNTQEASCRVRLQQSIQKRSH